MTLDRTAVTVAALEHLVATIRETGNVPNAFTDGHADLAEIIDVANDAAEKIRDYTFIDALRALTGRAPGLPVVTVDQERLIKWLTNEDNDRRDADDEPLSLFDFGESLAEAASGLLWDLIAGDVFAFTDGLELHVYPLAPDGDPSILICLARPDGVKVTDGVHEVRDLHPDPWSTDVAAHVTFVENVVAVANRVSVDAREIASL